MGEKVCYHCGQDCGDHPVEAYDKCFCCNGCKTVYEILNQNELGCYYDMESSPGNVPKEIQGKYDYLDNPDIAEKLIEFSDGENAIVEFYIPSIHCSACIWVLENLDNLNPAIVKSNVNFPQKRLRIYYKAKEISLKQIVELLVSIAYEPYISLEDTDKEKSKRVDKTLLYQLGIAGFGFGNVMLLAFPEYFQHEGIWLDEYKILFRYLMMFLALPVMVYGGKDYFITAYKGLKKGILSVDVPIALGMSVLFIRSVYEVLTGMGPGYFDSLTGLVFFLLVGKFFQQKTYGFLSFERDYRSYFPVAVTRIADGKEENIPVQDIRKGDRILIRHEELIPVDGILIRGEAHLDYSFVTGESVPVYKNNGEKIYAGAKQLGGAIEIDVINTISESYLTELWSNDAFDNDGSTGLKNLTDHISKYFTIVVLSISLVAGIYWFVHSGAGVAASVVTAVLIVACPCALALALPFSTGNMLRIFGYRKFYLKNADVIEKIAGIRHIIFDKTGTLTLNDQVNMRYTGEELSEDELKSLKTLLRSSNHPLSRILHEQLPGEADTRDIKEYKEIPGKGVEALIHGKYIKAGSAEYTGAEKPAKPGTYIFIRFDERVKGYFSSQNIYREGVKDVFDQIAKEYSISILSGDNEGEKEYLERLVPRGTEMLFGQSPHDKLEYVKSLQQKGVKVMMVGDGLNDAGALAQSDVGIAVSEDVNVFSPANDGILDAKVFNNLPVFLKLSKRTIHVVKWAFFFSFVYNIIGMYFALNLMLTPILAAILMPVSSISVVIYVTLATNFWAYYQQKNGRNAWKL